MINMLRQATRSPGLVRYLQYQSLLKPNRLSLPLRDKYLTKAFIRYNSSVETLNNNNNNNNSNSLLSDANHVIGDTWKCKRPKLVGSWLLCNAALVFGIVIVGGLTRLTESGLSMVDWQLVGKRPPSSVSDWQAEFDKYKQFPEFKIKNSKMELDEFKRIFWYEYAHRQFGRVIGLVFMIPATFFILRGYVNKPLRNRLILIGTGIGCQGLLGWYMVKSGLDNKIITESKEPRVSQYRLASHLCLAFSIYSLILTSGMRVLAITKPIKLSALSMLPNVQLGRASQLLLNNKAPNQSIVTPQLLKTANNINNKIPVIWSKLIDPVGINVATGLIFFTAMSGAFVAGLDAGLIYNEFPLMGNQWIPNDIWQKTLAWRNVFENPTTVQFDHRWLAISTSTFIFILVSASRKSRFILPKSIQVGLLSLAGMTGIQVTLGLLTLLYGVPIPLAASHQAGSLTLLTIALWTRYQFKFNRKLIRNAARLLKC